MPLYDQYAPYRKPLDDSEEALLVNTGRTGTVPPPSALEAEDVNEVYGMNGLIPNILRHLPQNLPQYLQPYVNNSTTAVFIRIARDRTAFDLQSINMPTEPQLDQRFPGIDPEGKHCHVDMGFAQRITRLTNAAALCDGETKELLDDFLNGYNPGINQLTADVKLTCRQIQLTEHMAKECPQRYVSAMLENAANNMAQNPNIQKMDRIITAMEQVVGLRGGVLDPQAIQDYNSLNPGVEMNGHLPTGFRVARKAPETFAVNFQSFDNIVRQNYYANPRNWGFIYDHKIPKEPAASDDLDACVHRYASSTASNALDGIFAATELQGLNADRASLVIVDGKTVNERMQEIYNGLEDKPNFTQWYKDNRDRMSGEIVAGALMAGKRVEAYVPGPDGKLPDQPTVLHKTGYEPTRDKPVTLNAWERFFNKLGFYKGKAAQAKEHQELLAARERLKANYMVAQNAWMQPSGAMAKEMFFGDYLRQNGIADMATLDTMRTSGSAYRLSRSGATSACVCILAAMGHDIRKILDPNQLQEEKKAAADNYLAHAFMNETLERLKDPKANLSPDERNQLTNKLMTAIENDADKKIAKIRSEKPNEQGDMTDEEWQQKNRELLVREHQVNTKLVRDLENMTQILNDPNYRYNPLDPRIPTALRAGDSQWLGSVYFHGQQALTKQINTIMAQTDLNDPAQRKAVFPTMSAAASILFDGFQETDRDMVVTQGYLRAAQQTALNNGQPAHAGNKLADDTMSTATSISTFFRTLDTADKARADLAGPRTGGNTKSQIKDLLMEKHLMTRFNESPLQRFSDRVPSDTIEKTLNAALEGDKAIRLVSDKLDERKSNWQADAKMILSGEFAKEFGVDTTAVRETITESRKILQTDPNGATRAVNVPQQIRITKVNAAKASITPSLANKLGFNVAQNNRGMGR